MPLKLNSLKSTLLWILIPAVILTSLTSLWVSGLELRDQVNAAFDRSLAGALRSIEVNVRTESGLAMEQPFYMLEFLELTTRSTVFFRVATEDNLSEIGYTELPLPDQPLLTNQPVFYNANYFDDDLRIAAVAIRPSTALPYSPDARIIIQVGERVTSRDNFLEQVMLQTLRKDIILLLVFVLLVSAGVILALRPLKETSEKIRNRSFDDLQPIEPETLPREIRPLIQAINLHMERYARKTQAQQQFLDDASHQLRTPLSVLNMQVDYARSLARTDEMREVLGAIQNRLTSTIQLTNQMVALARVHDAAEKLRSRAPRERVDLCELCEQVAGNLLSTARRKRLDFGLDLPDHPVMVNGIGWLLAEAISNIVANAIKYCPEGACITLAVIIENERICVQVDDNGPGMSPQDIALAGKRFRRGESGKAQQGSGLGLAIVQTIAEINRAELSLEPGPGATGLRVRLAFRVYPESSHCNQK